ncbi:response regulator transcription factor [Candidatus Sulfidibacterium hydrothermale]|jgi:DNA-binding response OmpR family regulator|uniref:response regulator transcription factor n=1 Tax=Candidatus Sulfidibacterium hydrothermale TaxID=2875962 RepID=UPI001F0A6934|nr:response regulator transcription factor [Candidatus Sulfidibacterium hydrothermale]UBM61961.1 response regulator transcription factor [Candidatus Sulfidibacterium hydrothermale]
MKLLIIEDDPEIQDSILAYLSPEGYICEQAFDFTEAADRMESFDYDCLLIDINLPDGSGLDLIRRAKQLKLRSGIIVITARDAINDRVKALEFGADDYLVKPFNLAELNARIKSLLRRIRFQGNNSITYEELEIFPDSFQVLVKGQPLELTKKEFELLLFFVSNAGRVIAKESLAGQLWGDDSDFSYSFDFVYAQIKNLRKKLREKGAADYIKTIYGVGYKFEKE